MHHGIVCSFCIVRGYAFQEFRSARKCFQSTQNDLRNKMDLWSVTTEFFLQHIKAGQFRVSDILALANQLNVQLKPPRNSNADQLSFLVKDLFDELRQKRYAPLSMANAMTQMKPFEKVGIQLKDLLVTEMLQDQNKELFR